MAEFERSESYEFAARVRKYDDAAKTFGLEIPSLDAYVPMIAKHLEKNLGKVENSSIISPYAHSYVLSIPQLHQWDKNGMPIFQMHLMIKLKQQIIYKFGLMKLLNGQLQ